MAISKHKGPCPHLICRQGGKTSPRAAVATGNTPLDPQLQLLIEAWPTLSKEVQQQIMLLVG